MKNKTYSLVGRKLGESSLFFMMSLHFPIVSNKSNESPTTKSVAKFLANNFLVGGPGDSLI
jgi:hypothetical protein